MSAALAADLASLLGADAVKAGEAVAALDPGWHPGNLGAGLVVLPSSAPDVARVLAFCAARGVGVVPQGGRTGLAGGAVSRPGEVVLSTARLSRIRALDPLARTVTVEAGVVLARLQDAVAAQDLDIGIDIAARDSATIGGMVATCAGGIRAFRSGTMRHRVLGLEAAFADGSVLDDLTSVLKTSCGPDIKHLLVGSEGTLGVVTAAVLRLDPAPGPAATALLALPDADAGVRVVDALLRRADGTLRAAELMTGGFAVGSARANGIDPGALRLGAPLHLIVEVAAPDEASAHAALEAGLGAIWEEARLLDAVVAASGRQRDAIWRIREASDAMGRGYGVELWYDVSLPPPAIRAYLAEVGTRLAALDPPFEMHAIGHLADGNLHVMAARREAPAVVPHEAIEAAIYEGLRAVGGCLSAEHGIGLDKRRALARYGDPGRLAAARRVKAAFDPAGILNPGKVFGAVD